ncbi:MAG: hypothetical protein A2157_05165 [Deltaproteobacteria bacterium RBG_16_47_11]|nr:MAG: hypothetical protein A2157_05165 [Deltaproteobacteria bacterium RBG_16_47_11]
MVPTKTELSRRRRPPSSYVQILWKKDGDKDLIFLNQFNILNDRSNVNYKNIYKFQFVMPYSKSDFETRVV